MADDDEADKRADAAAEVSAAIARWYRRAAEWLGADIHQQAAIFGSVTTETDRWDLLMGLTMAVGFAVDDNGKTPADLAQRLRTLADQVVLHGIDYAEQQDDED